MGMIMVSGDLLNAYAYGSAITENTVPVWEIGALTIEQIHNYRFDLAFIGTVGMNIHDDKVTTYDVEDGLTKKEVMDASKKCLSCGRK